MILITIVIVIMLKIRNKYKYTELQILHSLQVNITDNIQVY